jgi:hypothetical protein
MKPTNPPSTGVPANRFLAKRVAKNANAPNDNEMDATDIAHFSGLLRLVSCLDVLATSAKTTIENPVNAVHNDTREFSFSSSSVLPDMLMFKLSIS